jgi:uncharacterized cupin superfamily protein
VNALTVLLDHEPLPADQVLSGSPTTGSLVLDERHGREIGIWEMTPGVATDIEVDEVFVVLAGAATVEGVEEEPIELAPGSTVTLTAGMSTIWTVHETLRKIYVIHAGT